MSDGINVQEIVGKTVGRRRIKSSAEHAMALQKMVNDVRKSQGYGGICPRGVYRFNSHEEADAWLMKAMAQRAARRAT